MGELLDRIRSYYAALNVGDVAAVASYFVDDATHYYTSLAPTTGAQQIADLAVLAHRTIEGRYYIEDAVDDGDQVAVEWTMTWRDPGSGRLRSVRGAEFYRFHGDLIYEVRSYNGASDSNRGGDLVGFDHAGRGYMTLDGRR